MKNNDFKRKAGLKEVLDEASPDQIEIFIEKNKNSGVSDETLENIKTKVFQKTGLENIDTKEEVLKSIVEKNKKTYIRRWIYAAAVSLLAVIVAVGGKYIHLGDTPPIVSGDISEDKSTEIENSVESENSEDGENSVDNVNSSHVSTEEYKDMFQDGDFEIKGINWRCIESNGNYYDGVKNILDNLTNSDKAWALVTLKSITPIGSFERELYYDGTCYKFPDIKLSVAEITINKIYHIGDVEENLREGDKIKILVTWLVEDDKIYMTHGTFEEEKEKYILNFPMTEVEKPYIISLNKIKNEVTEKIIEENAIEYKDLLASNFAYPIFADDFTKIKNMSEYKYAPACVQIYVAAYDRYIKENVSENSLETKFYNCFKEAVYNIFGPTPENPRAKSVKEK